MKLRKLTAAEVEFEESTEPEDIQVEGNFMATDDDAADRAAEQELIARLNRGDESAWCVLCVKATWKGYVGRASLGGYVFPEGQSGEQNRLYAQDEYRQLRADALADLNERIASAVRSLQELIQ